VLVSEFPISLNIYSHLSHTPKKLFKFLQDFNTSDRLSGRLESFLKAEMSTKIPNITAPEMEIEFIATPDPAPQTFNTDTHCGVNIISVRVNF